MRAAVALLAYLILAAPAAAQTPVLGSPEYVPNGAGFGTAKPTMFFNGGVPSGRMEKIKWTGWGGKVAHGRGKAAIYRPQGGYYPPVDAQLRVRGLATCPGRSEPAYTLLEVRIPQWPGGPLGSWFKWSGSRTICSFDDQDPAYQRSPAPGTCASVGEYGEPGTAQSIAVYRIKCATARKLARQATRHKRPFSCLRRGCTARLAKHRCRFERLRDGEMSGGVVPYPVQRLACRRGAATMSAFLVLHYD